MTGNHPSFIPDPAKKTHSPRVNDCASDVGKTGVRGVVVPFCNGNKKQSHTTYSLSKSNKSI